jgi:hypothetical protein
VLIGGFIITGNVPKKVLLMAKGPSLSSNGVPASQCLVDPTLTLYDNHGNLLETNDNWKTSPQHSEIASSGLAPKYDTESAILRSLAPGAYTAIVRGKNNTTGVGLVEAFDRDPAAHSVLANISTRGFVETDNNVMIGGFIAGNKDGATQILVRAIGPSLKSKVPNALEDPFLELHDSNGATIGTNDNWKDNQQADIQATGIPPKNDLESAMLRTLAPAAYTAIVRGKNDMTGVGLVEVYNIVK